MFVITRAIPASVDQSNIDIEPNFGSKGLTKRQQVVSYYIKLQKTTKRAVREEERENDRKRKRVKRIWRKEKTMSWKKNGEKSEREGSEPVLLFFGLKKIANSGLQ